MENEYVPYFRTQDFNEALILKAAGAILDSVEWNYEEEVGTFLFENTVACNGILDKHKHKDLWLLSQDALNAYRDVKNELYRNR